MVCKWMSHAIEYHQAILSSPDLTEFVGFTYVLYARNWRCRRVDNPVARPKDRAENHEAGQIAALFVTQLNLNSRTTPCV